MTRADVSAIVPVRNGAAFIGDALRSVLGQTTLPREIIVVDDGSTDQTAEVVKTFPEVIYHYQTNSGAAEARNVGVRLATSAFVAFLDADDLWTRQKTELQLRLMLEQPKVGIVSGRMQQFYESATGERILHGEPAESQLLTALLVRRDVFWQVGALSTALAVGETIEWWSRAIDLRVCCIPVPEVVYLRRRHPNNLGRRIDSPRRGYLKMLNEVVKRRRDQGHLTKDG